MQQYKNIIFINAFVVGAVIMAMEMTGSRFLTPFFGSSVFTWASIISMVLLALAIGYFAGGYLAEKIPVPAVAGFIIMGAAFTLLFVPLYFESLFKWIHKVVPDNNLGGFLSALLILFLPLSLLGIYSPFSVKLGTVYSLKSGKIAGNLYAISTIGSIVGTLGVTFFLIPYMGSKNITFTLSFISFLSAVSLILLKLPEAEIKAKNIEFNYKKAKLTAGILFAVYIVLFILIIFRNSIGTKLGYVPAPSKYLVEEVESKYNTIQIKQKGEYVTMLFNRFNTNHIESKRNILNPNELPMSYSRLMTTSLFYTPEPQNTLMIGLGGGSVVSYMQSYYPEMKTTGVELDELVVELAKKYFELKPSEKLDVVVQDGRLYLDNTTNKFDIIMLDAYKGGSIPFHLCTFEFYTMAADKLNKGGCIALNLHRGSKLFNRIIYTLTKVFANVDIYGSPTTGNAVAIAYQDEAKTDAQITSIADSLQQKYNFYHSLTELPSLKIELPDIQNMDALTDDFAPINFLNAIEEHNQKEYP